MLARVTCLILVQGLTLLGLSPAYGASPLGAVVHVVPLESNEGKTVRAHFMLVAPNPCPDLSGVCAEGEDCMVHPFSIPLNGIKPTLGWCVRQWQKTIPSDYNATINLGSQIVLDVVIKAEPLVKTTTGRLNRPPFVALPPPLRAHVNCPHHIHLSVHDLDQDKVRCRFARADQGECRRGCSQHSFIQLNEEKCTLSFTGEASAGQYPIILMVEDILPVSRMSSGENNKPLSSIPVHLTLSVEEASSSCSAEPVATGQTPQNGAKLTTLPYEQVNITVSFISGLESISEIAVVGPSGLFKSGLKRTGATGAVTVAWVRGLNQLAPLLPICFSANTNSLQSEPRCLWIYQREMRALPAGTELKCSNAEMTLVLPVTTLRNVNMSQLQLNSPTCAVTYNNTHLTAHIPLTGCGTKIVHVGSELIYTNVLQSVRTNTVISRQPSLVLPLACRISGVQTKGQQYKIIKSAEREIFGNVTFWLEFFLPGQGPLSNITRAATFRQLDNFPTRRVRHAVVLQGAGSRAVFPTSQNGVKSRISYLDLYVMSNSRRNRVELMVDNCMESESEDFTYMRPLLDQGCIASNGTLEVISTETYFKIYRLDLSAIETRGTTMFVECKVHLCIATMPSQKCPDPCVHSTNNSTLTDWLVTRIYMVRSRAVSLTVTQPAPNNTAALTTISNTAATITKPATSPTTVVANHTTTSKAPDETPVMTVAAVMTIINVYIQITFFY